MDPLENPWQVVKNVVVLKSEHGIAESSEALVPVLIVLLLLLMHWAIDLYHKSSSKAHEIDDVRTQLVLAAELPTGELAIAQSVPKTALGLCLSSPQLPPLQPAFLSLLVHPHLWRVQSVGTSTSRAVLIPVRGRCSAEG